MMTVATSARMVVDEGGVRAMSEGGEARKWVQSDRDGESVGRQVERGTEMDKEIKLKPRQE